MSIKNTSNRSATIYIAISAILVGLLQKYCPQSELQFATITLTFCLLLFAIIADPTSFFETLFTEIPFVKSILPKVLYDHICKSIECLKEGERRLANLDAKRLNGSSSESKYTVSNQTLLNEIHKRIQWKYIIPAILSGIIVEVIKYQKPKVIGIMFDKVVQPDASMSSAFYPFLRQLILYTIFDYIFISLREYYKHAALHRYQAQTRVDMISNILDQDMNYIHSHYNNEHTSSNATFTHLMNQETIRMQKIVNESITRLFFGCISTVGGLHTLLHADYRLALLAIFVKSPILASLHSLSRRDIVKYGQLYDASKGDANRLASSILSPEVIHLLQSTVSQNKLINLYQKKQNEFIEYLTYTHFRQTLLCMVGHGVRNLEDILLLGMGLASVLNGQLTLGEYITFRSHLALLDQGPKQLLGLWNDVLTIRMSAAVYFELLYRESEIPCSRDRHECGVGRTLPDDNMNDGLTISLKNVYFAYQLHPELNVLEDISLSIRPGHITALCGGSGGGKTSITRLINRFYDPTQGRVELNGIDIKSLDVAWLRSKIAVIDQDPILPDMSIKDNIALGLSDEDSSRGEEYILERVVEAAKLSEAHEFIINKCEQGYDTPVRHIHRLSGGQKQRIAIARALISRAPILICDEVTSSLDSETEKTIISTLFNAMKDKSVLVIAHRMSTIRHADEIIFLEHGKIVERGTHDELVQLDRRYSGYLKTHSSLSME